MCSNAALLLFIEIIPKIIPKNKFVIEKDSIAKK